MRDYPDVTTHRERSVLPEPLQRAVAQLCDELGRGRADPTEVSAVVTGLSQLPPEAYRRAAREIVAIGRLWTMGSGWGLLDFGWSDRALLKKSPGLEFLYLFHGVGYLREQSLAKIDGPLESPFFFNSIAYRLNDWVLEVRRAASACAARVFPKTPPDVVAQAAFVLLGRIRHWRRGQAETAILEQTFARPDVTERLAVLLANTYTGPAGTVLTEALRFGPMDAHLLHLSRNAHQPTVRAVALRALIEGRARWPDGYRDEWIDKSMGRWRRVPTYGERELCRPTSVETLVAQGADDKSAPVRRAAADGLVAHRTSLKNLDSLLQRFANDKSAAVRERAEFVVEELRRGGVP